MKAVSKNDTKFNILILLIYAVLILVIMYFHEPWYDEAEAWLIARDCSWHDILLVRPHYEGHPPFWWLLLAVPARLGIPYEIGLKSVQFLCAVLMIGVLEFRSPFPRWLKVSLPFTYFLFYQYGVISRPYALTVTALFLCGDFWKDKDKKPWRMVLSLYFSCLTSAYGIAIAGGMAVVWVIRSIKEGAFFKSRRRFFSWLFLLSAALILLVLIWPKNDTFANDLYSSETSNSLFFSFYILWFALPSEMFFSSVFGDKGIHFLDFTTGDLIWMTCISLFVWAFYIHIARRRKILPELVVPYLFLSIVGTKYFFMHHIGILYAYFIMILWMNYDVMPLSSEDLTGRTTTFLQNTVSEKRLFIIRKLLSVFFCFIALISIYWSLSASVQDIEYPYSEGRTLARFIEDHHLEHYSWMGGWQVVKKTAGEEDEYFDNTHELSSTCYTVNAYFNQNLFENACNGYSYDPHDSSNENESSGDITRWKHFPEPDFFIPFIGNTEDLEKLGFDASDYRTYNLVTVRQAWKNGCSYKNISVVMKKAVYDKIIK